MNMKDFPARFKAAGEPCSWSTPCQEDGCDLYTMFKPSERYEIDFADGFNSEGWEQFDTDQDAPYLAYGLTTRRFSSSAMRRVIGR